MRCLHKDNKNDHKHQQADFGIQNTTRMNDGVDHFNEL